jgi:hypothetical protein
MKSFPQRHDVTPQQLFLKSRTIDYQNQLNNCIGHTKTFA